MAEFVTGDIVQVKKPGSNTLVLNSHRIIHVLGEKSNTDWTVRLLQPARRLYGEPAWIAQPLYPGTKRVFVTQSNIIERVKL